MSFAAGCSEVIMVLLSLIPLPRPPVTVPFMPPVGPPVMLLFSFKFTHPSPLHSGLRVTVGTDVGKEARAGGGGGEGLPEQGRSGREDYGRIAPTPRPRQQPLRGPEDDRGRDDDRGRRRRRRRRRRESSIGAGCGYGSCSAVP